ncbi:hypothetical protein Ahy_A01g002523 [Arachis hypogaea]|uniref:Uncharacterized protein n=1 Tax=Arachis hypogaea TaxID=3818 RepID=A0A445ERD1_ARAHY|nr:hypothetical protein Ahy_A01g002523 [Arachis hypogaea]
MENTLTSLISLTSKLQDLISRMDQPSTSNIQPSSFSAPPPFVQEYPYPSIQEQHDSNDAIDPEQERRDCLRDIMDWLYARILQEKQEEAQNVESRKSSVGLGYACQWTKIFKWLGIDLSEEKSIVLSNVAKIDDSILRKMGRDLDVQEPQAQGQPSDPEVQAQSQESPAPPPPSLSIGAELAAFEVITNTSSLRKKKEKKLDGRCFCGLEVALMESGTCMRLRSGKIIHMADELSNVNGGSSTNDNITVSMQ